MKKLLFAGLVLSFMNLKAQVIVNGNDINKTATTLEVWAIAKPFNTKESMFADYGQDDFKSHYYDHKSQAINDKDGKKFEKGEWVKLLNYLTSEGWEMKSERPGNVGDQKGRIITFVRKQ